MHTICMQGKIRITLNSFLLHNCSGVSRKLPFLYMIGTICLKIVVNPLARLVNRFNTIWCDIIETSLIYCLKKLRELGL